MSNTKTSLRPAMTSLAAVIAISSTPLLAQSADSAAASPSVEAAPALTLAPPVVAPEVAAPAMATPVTEASPAVVETADTVPSAAPETATPTAAPARTARRVEPRVEPKSTSATAVATPPAPGAVAPVQKPMPDAFPVSGTAEPVATQATQRVATRSETDGGEVLPIAGIAGAGVLAAAGTAYALGRRRRRRAEGDRYAEDLAPAAVMAPPYSLANAGPAWTAEPAVSASRRPAQSHLIQPRSDADLPEGFDLSIYGPHAQQAFRGPTEDNPSRSLTKRLKRAHFFDQRDRRLKPTETRQAPSAPAFSSWQNARTLEPAH